MQRKNTCVRNRGYITNMNVESVSKSELTETGTLLARKTQLALIYHCLLGTIVGSSIAR